MVNKGKPNHARVTHGLRSAYIRKSDLPIFIAALKDVEENDGAALLAAQAAWAETRVEVAMRDAPETLMEPQAADLLHRTELLAQKALEVRGRILHEREALARTGTVPVIQMIGSSEAFDVRVGDGDQIARAMLDPSDRTSTLVEFRPGVWTRAVADANEVYHQLLDAGDSE